MSSDESPTPTFSRVSLPLVPQYSQTSVFKMSPTEIVVAFILAVIAALLVPVLVFLFRGFIGKLIAKLIPPLEPRSVRGDWDTKFHDLALAISGSKEVNRP